MYIKSPTIIIVQTTKYLRSLTPKQPVKGPVSLPPYLPHRTYLNYIPYPNCKYVGIICQHRKNPVTIFGITHFTLNMTKQNRTILCLLDNARACDQQTHHFSYTYNTNSLLVITYLLRFYCKDVTLCPQKEPHLCWELHFPNCLPWLDH